MQTSWKQFTSSNIGIPNGGGNDYLTLASCQWLVVGSTKWGFGWWC